MNSLGASFLKSRLSRTDSAPLSSLESRRFVFLHIKVPQTFAPATYFSFLILRTKGIVLYFCFNIQRGGWKYMTFYYKKHLNGFRRMWFSVLTMFLSSLVPAFHIYVFIKQFKCCGLIDGASDWGSNFQQNSESCECSDMSDSSCISYEGKHVYKQVRKNQTCHSKWFWFFFSRMKTSQKFKLQQL